MNKLIKELADQAGFVMFSPQEDPHIPIDWSSDYTSELAKFANLIIKHCGYYADVFDSVGCPVDMDPTETRPSDYIMRRMGSNDA